MKNRNEINDIFPMQRERNHNWTQDQRIQWSLWIMRIQTQITCWKKGIDTNVLCIFRWMSRSLILQSYTSMDHCDINRFWRDSIEMNKNSIISKYLLLLDGNCWRQRKVVKNLTTTRSLLLLFYIIQIMGNQSARPCEQK